MVSSVLESAHFKSQQPGALLTSFSKSSKCLFFFFFQFLPTFWMPAQRDRRQGPREAVQLNGYCVNSVVPCSVWALNWLISTCTAPNQALPVPPPALPSIISYHPSWHTRTKQDSQWSKPFYEQAFLFPVKMQNWAVTGSSCLQ